MSVEPDTLPDDGRVTIRFDASLLAAADALVDDGQYPNRSAAVRDVFRRGLAARAPYWLGCDPRERTRPIPRSLAEICEVAADAETVLEAHRRLGNSTLRTTECVLGELGFVDANGELHDRDVRAFRAAWLRLWYGRLEDGDLDG